jgi:acyl carrier protein
MAPLSLTGRAAMVVSEPLVYPRFLSLFKRYGLLVPSTDLYEKLTDIFRDIFDDDDLVLTGQMTAEDVDEWDSLSHIRLIVAVEKDFGVSFSSSEIASLENVAQLAELTERKLGE